MKNIFVLPTSGKSRLFKNNISELLSFRKYNDLPLNHTIQNLHIYITSDEEIKDGDWVISNYSELIKISYKGSKVKQNVNEFCKKIILTTDQDLINDGVQKIDDEFLEWFVKNPSCEEVKIESWQTKGEWDLDYKIIIPKEEPKQETLEEAVEKYAEGKSSSSVFQEAHKNDFIAGAKWQQERMYSEEDMKDYALKCISNYLFGNDFISDNLRIPIVENNNKQLEQFKKK